MRSVGVRREGFEPDDGAEGVAVLYSTAAQRLSWEDPQLGHGVFTHYLAEGLEGAAADDDGLVTFDGLRRYVSGKVKRHVLERFDDIQVPYIGGERTGEFVLARVEGRAGAAGPLAGGEGGADDGAPSPSRPADESGGTPALAGLDFGHGPRPPTGRVRDTAAAAEKTAYTQAYDLLARGRIDEAVARFGAFLREYPDGPKAGDALKRIGYALYEQGDYARARIVVTAVQNKYPGRSAAVLARKRLRQMDRDGH